MQVDLSKYGLDKYGVVWSMSQPLVQQGVNLLYLSTATAAHVFVSLFFDFTFSLILYCTAVRVYVCVCLDIFRWMKKIWKRVCKF